MSDHFALTALSPLDGRYARQTSVLAAYFSEFALIRYRVRVEVEYLIALLQALGHPGGTPETVAALRACYVDFGHADARAIKDHEAQLRHDVKAVEYWVKDRVRSLPGLEDVVEWVHMGLTSEDVNNLAYGLMQADALKEVVLPAYADVLERLRDLAVQYRAVPMLARTHGQPATPTTMGKELAVFGDRLHGELAQLQALPLQGKLNGATGTFAALAVAYPGHDWPAFSRAFVSGLGLRPSELTTQIEPRDSYARVYDAMRRMNRILLDLSQDLWRYVSDGYFKQRVVEDEVGSSAMPHKVNPIDFENAEGNLGLANALWVHLGDKLTVSRLQRDLSDSTVLRNVGVAFGHSLLATVSLMRGLSKIDLDTSRLASELEAHPEVLAEAIQTILRAEGHPNPYEAMKALTRGQSVSADALKEAAASMLPDKPELWTSLTPAGYIGLAPELTDLFVAKVDASLPLWRQSWRS